VTELPTRYRFRISSSAALACSLVSFDRFMVAPAVIVGSVKAD
jgi:hypothetical protein